MHFACGRLNAVYDELMKIIQPEYVRNKLYEIKPPINWSQLVDEDKDLHFQEKLDAARR